MDIYIPWDSKYKVCKTLRLEGIIVYNGPWIDKATLAMAAWTAENLLQSGCC